MIQTWQIKLDREKLLEFIIITLISSYTIYKHHHYDYIL
jgi:hypothetical protein